MPGRQIKVEGEIKDGKYLVILSSDDGRRDVETYDTEAEAMEVIDRMMKIARAKEAEGVVTIAVDDRRTA